MRVPSAALILGLAVACSSPRAGDAPAGTPIGSPSTSGSPDPLGPDGAIPASAPLAHHTSRWQYLRERYDANQDDVIEAAEYARGDSAFAQLDRDADGVITGLDFAQERGSATEFMVEILVGNYFHSDRDVEHLEAVELEDTLSSFDDDEDGKLGPEEFAVVMAEQEVEPLDHVFQAMLGERSVFDFLASVIDTDGDGLLSGDELAAFHERQFGESAAEEPVSLAEMVRENRERAASEAANPPGPPGAVAVLGQVAPDFTLRPPDGGEPITLSAFAGDRPVALIFGSYT